MSVGTRALPWWLGVTMALASCSGGEPPPSTAPSAVGTEPSTPTTSEPTTSAPTAPTPTAPTPTAPTPGTRTAGTPPPPSRLETQGPYQVDVGRDCDGWPHVPLETTDALCVGLALHRGSAGVPTSGGPFRPRTVVEDPACDGVLWVIDAGGHRDRGGRLHRLDTHARPPTLERVVDRLDRPHGGAIGPDGWLYVGETSRIVRFDPSASDVGASREIVIDGLPTQIPGRDRIRFHPLSAFVFTAEWELVLDRGSSTDHCAESLVDPPAPQPRCHDEAEETASVLRYTHAVVEGRHVWSSPRVIGRGLRNSVALSAHATGTILQAENGVDFPEDDRPFEELNVLSPREDARAHFGWPYCFDRDRADLRWERAGFSCDPTVNTAYAAPHLLLPPHGAPLGLTYYEGTIDALRGQLLVVLHGYRARGHRVLALAVDAHGLPAADATPREIVGGWDAADDRPRGAPVSATVARDGSVWLVEDNNGTILRLARDAYAASRAGTHATEGPVPPADAAFVALHRDVLTPRCAHCHEPLRLDADHALAAIRREGWLRDDEGAAHLWQRVRPGATRRMPLDGRLTDAETEAIAVWLGSLTPR